MDSIKCTASNGIEKAETNSGDIYLLINNSYLRFPPTVNSIDAVQYRWIYICSVIRGLPTIWNSANLFWLNGNWCLNNGTKKSRTKYIALTYFVGFLSRSSVAPIQLNNVHLYSEHCTLHDVQSILILSQFFAFCLSLVDPATDLSVRKENVSTFTKNILCMKPSWQMVFWFLSVEISSIKRKEVNISKVSPTSNFLTKGFERSIMNSGIRKIPRDEVEQVWSLEAVFLFFFQYCHFLLQNIKQYRSGSA